MIYLILVLYSSLHGVDNGILYSRKGSETVLGWLEYFKQDEHAVFKLENLCLGVGILAGMYYGMGGHFWEVITELLAGWLAFPFFHDGMKNYTLDELLETDYGWKYSSPNSVAKLNFTYPQRLGMFLASFGVLAGGYFWL